MGHSQAEKAASRERILEAAARQIREGGLESLSIGELMKSANLTHGGFYGHFPSRSALIAAALDRALAQSEMAFGTAQAGRASLERLLDAYLSPAHRDDRRHGCAIASLACDAARAEDPDVRAHMSRRIEQSLARIGQAMGDDDAAVLALSAMVGALSLARVTEGTPLSDRFLSEVRAQLLALGTARTP